MAMLLYDSDCGFCTRSAKWVERHSSGLTVKALYEADLASLGVDEMRSLTEVPFVHDDGRVTWGSDAMGDALRYSGMPWSIAGAVITAWPVRLVARRVYPLVARNRHRLPGGTAACELPKQ